MVVTISVSSVLPGQIKMTKQNCFNLSLPSKTELGIAAQTCLA